VQQNHFVFFELLLDISGSKYDLLRLSIVQQWLFIRFQQLIIRRLSYFIKCTTKPYFHGCFGVDIDSWRVFLNNK